MDKICYTYRVAVRPFPFKGKEHFMGKNLKGKDCGKGIYQRKDGLYSADTALRRESHAGMIAVKP